MSGEEFTIEGRTVIADIAVACLCGGKVHAGMRPEGFVIHSFPYCTKFDELNPVDFLAYLRVSLDKKS